MWGCEGDVGGEGDVEMLGDVGCGMCIHYIVRTYSSVCIHTCTCLVCWTKW